MDGVSACRTLWLAAVYNLLVVSQEYGPYDSVLGKNLYSFWYHTFSAVCRRRYSRFFDGFTKKASGAMVEIE